MTDRERSWLAVDAACHALERVWAIDRDETHPVTAAALRELSGLYLVRDVLQAELS